MTIASQNKVVYGPVYSRRLGTSLGVNILSPERKICNFNCVYCQYNWTKLNKQDLSDTNNFINIKEVLIAVEKALTALSPSPDYITFSGNGEATLHPEFRQIVEGVVHLRNVYAKNSKTAILSNSMGVLSTEIRKVLAKLDEKIMKLDCGNDQMLKLYNRPLQTVYLDSIVKKLATIQNITIQSLFTRGAHGNSEDEHVLQWIDKIKYIKPKHVQIYTLDRGYPSSNIYPVSFKWLYELEVKLNKIGIKSKAYI